MNKNTSITLKTKRGRFIIADSGVHCYYFFDGEKEHQVHMITGIFRIDNVVSNLGLIEHDKDYILSNKVRGLLLHYVEKCINTRGSEGASIDIVTIARVFGMCHGTIILFLLDHYVVEKNMTLFCYFERKFRPHPFVYCFSLVSERPGILLKEYRYA